MMPMTHVRLPVWALLAALLAASAIRAQDAAISQPEAPRYEVELIVFRHLDERDTTAEANRPEIAPPGALPTLGRSSATSALPPAWTPLAPSSLRLASVAARLRRGGAYQLLYHGGWIQGVEPQAQSIPVPLPPDAERAGAAGGVNLYRARFLHVDVDLGLFDANGGRDRSRWIRQGRRLRGSAVQYFDNPAVGVILAARPLAGSDQANPE
jgi:hypothetical protein